MRVLTVDLIFGAVYRGFFMGYVIRSSDTTSINGIRQLVSVNLSSDLLSDSVIDSPAFERAAEFHVYRLLNFLSDDSGNVDADGKYAQRIGLDNSARSYAFQFAPTFSYKGLYINTTNYQQNDVVRTEFPDKLYYANKNITGSVQNSINSDWKEITNIDFKGIYANNTMYNQYDIVYTGSPEKLYYAKSSIPNTQSSFVDNQWIEIISGIRILVGQTAAQRQSEERIKIAVQYQTAIRLILSMPQLLEEQILRERVRFQEINWEKRIEFYESETTDTLEPEVPDGTIFSDATAIFGEVKQFVAF